MSPFHSNFSACIGHTIEQFMCPTFSAAHRSLGTEATLLASPPQQGSERGELSRPNCPCCSPRRSVEAFGRNAHAPMELVRSGGARVQLSSHHLSGHYSGLRERRHDQFTPVLSGRRPAALQSDKLALAFAWKPCRRGPLCRVESCERSSERHVSAKMFAESIVSLENLFSQFNRSSFLLVIDSVTP